MRFLGLDLPPELEAAGRACAEHLRLAAVLSALINILYLAPTIYMIQVYDRVVATGGVVTLLWLTVIAGFALATLAILDSVRARTMVRAGLRIDRLLSRDLLNRIFDRSGARPAQAVMRDFDTVRQAFAGPPAIALMDAPWAPIYILVAFLLHPLLGLAILLGALVLLAISILNERATRSATRSAMRSLNATYLEQERLVAHGELIRTLGMRSTMVERQAGNRSQGLAQASAYQFTSGQYGAVTKFARLFLQSLALGIGAWLAVERQISIGAIIAASVLMGRALQPIEALVGTWKPIIEAREALGNLAALYTDANRARPPAFELPTPAGKVECKAVTIWNPLGGPPLLAGVGLVSNPGELIGVTGPSGAGKSTLLRTIVGGLLPDAGEVRIDGSEIRDWNMETLAQHIGYMPQDCGLLPGTIAENVSRFAAARSGGDDVSGAVLEAAAAAGAHQMITALPNGYNHAVGWHGDGLSVGQRQRVALARALYRNPPILILDEPNAALDAEGEAALLQAIAAARARGATVILSAHRAVLLGAATRILVLVGGRVHMWGEAAEIRARLAGRSGEPVLVESGNVGPASIAARN